MAHKLTTLDRRILLIAVPSTIGYVTTPLIGIVDTAIVGRLDDIAMLAGLALGALAIDVILTSANFLRSGTTGLTAQALGKNDLDECREILWRAVIIAVCIGVFIAAFRHLIIDASIYLMGAKESVAEAVKTYLIIRLLSTPFALVNYAILGFLFGMGRSFWALTIQVSINLSNIALSIKWGLWDGLGIAGVAQGTLAAELVGVVLGAFLICGVMGLGLPTSLKSLFAPKAFKILTQLNFDIMIRSFVLLAAFALFTRYGSALGKEKLAANAILMHFFLLGGYFLDGLATASEQLCGFAKGKRDKALFVMSQKRTLLWSILIAIVIFLIFLTAYQWFVSALTNNQSLIGLVDHYAYWAIITPLTGVLAFHYDGVYIGSSWTRDMRKMMILSFTTFAISATFFAWAFDNHGLWFALNLFLFARGLLLRHRMPKNMIGTF